MSQSLSSPIAEVQDLYCSKNYLQITSSLQIAIVYSQSKNILNFVFVFLDHFWL